VFSPLVAYCQLQCFRMFLSAYPSCCTRVNQWEYMYIRIFEICSIYYDLQAKSQITPSCLNYGQPRHDPNSHVCSENIEKQERTLKFIHYHNWGIKKYRALARMTNKPPTSTISSRTPRDFIEDSVTDGLQQQP